MESSDLMAPVDKLRADREAQAPDAYDHQPKIVLDGEGPLLLDSGVSLAPLTITYQAYGELNAHKSNAILICHALTGDQYVSGVHPVTGRPGWWDNVVGPGRPLDTDHYFVLTINY